MDIKTNIESVLANISDAAKRVGRNPEDIVLAAVTKFQSSESINAAIDSGVRVIAENRAQELAEKYPRIKKPEDLQIHFIGHLQTNKIKYIIDKVDMIQSVDSLYLADEINRQCIKHNRCVDILIQINIGKEEQKYGFDIEKAVESAIHISCLSNLKLCGVMGILPNGVSEDRAKELFSQLNKLFLDIKAKIYDNTYMNVISMGMTNDYQWAVESGSTLVRVGRGIFGERI